MSSLLTKEQLDLIEPKLLPPQMRQLVSIIGLPDTVKLLQARGGTFFRFPLKAHDSLLADIIGNEPAALLCNELGGKTWELPKCDKILNKIRNIAIQKARETHSASEVARMFDLTRRHIINITPRPELKMMDDFFD